MLEERGQITATNIYEFINRGGNYFSTIARVPTRIIGATTKKGNTIRRLGDKHLGVSHSGLFTHRWVFRVEKRISLIKTIWSSNIDKWPIRNVPINSIWN